MAIPKIIHQTFVRKNDLPSQISDVLAMFKQHNPDWEHRLYDDQDMLDFIEDNYDSNVLRVYNKINPLYGAARADLFRYLLIYKVGGAYFDIKSFADRSLDDIINGHDYVLAHWAVPPVGKWGMDFVQHPNGEYQQWHVIAAPEHPFLKAVVDLVLSNIEGYSIEKYGVAKLGVLELTGPRAYTRAIAPLEAKYPHQHYKNEVQAGLVYSLLGWEGHKKFFPVSHPHYSTIVAPIVFHDEHEMAAYKEHVVARLFEISKSVRYG